MRMKVPLCRRARELKRRHSHNKLNGRHLASVICTRQFSQIWRPNRPLEYTQNQTPKKTSWL
jgi:hypothetical protein